jgi:hypothetical protein
VFRRGIPETSVLLQYKLINLELGILAISLFLSCQS